MLWENLREEEFEPMLLETNRVCAMAIGCVEMHGQHLPLGTDTLKGGKILVWAAEREPVCVLPHFYYGDVSMARGSDPQKGETHYGYLALSNELMLALLKEICDEAYRNGFNKIVLFSSHGGNKALMDTCLKSAIAEKKPYEVFMVNNRLVMPKDILEVIGERGREIFPALTDSDIATLEDFVEQGKWDEHAGFAETALLMGTYPDLVRLDRAEALSGMPTHKTDFLNDAGILWWKYWDKEYPNAYCGHAPVGMTQAIANAATEIAVERAANAFKILKDDALMKSIL